MRLVYTKAGKNLVAAVVRDRNAVIDHKLYWRGVGLAEAHYVCVILNSEAARKQVEQYQSQGQWGARDFDKYVFNLPIPLFDKDDGLHRQLVVAAKAAEKVAGRVDVEPGAYFLRTRRAVRKALAEDGIGDRVEELVGDLLRDAG